MNSEFVQAVKDTVRDLLGDVHTAMPGTIKTLDVSTGLATVLPAGKFKTGTGVELEYPAISGVPVVFPYSQTAAAGVVFPVKEGDGCLLVIAEQALDAWLYGGETTVDLKHDLTNAIAIPGLFTTANTFLKEAVEPGAVVIYSGPTKITVSKGSTTIKGDLIVQGNIQSSGDIKAGGSLSTPSGSVDAGGTMTVKALDVSGAANVGGALTASSISATGDVKAGSISLKTHKHTSAPSGEDTSTPK